MSTQPRCRIHLDKTKIHEWQTGDYYSDYGTDKATSTELARLIRRDLAKFKIKSVEEKAEIPKERRNAIIREALKLAVEKYYQ